MVDFLVIGAQKAGTGWLRENLKNHPEIWTPLAKEIHFFDQHFTADKGRNRAAFSRFQRRSAKMIELHLARDPVEYAEIEYYARIARPDFAYTLEWYDYLFSPAPSDSKKGEITPSYCAMNEDGIEFIKKRYQQVRIIYMIRDPLSRLLSSLRMLLTRNPHDAQNLHAEASRCLDRKSVIDLGDYRGNISRWDRHFQEAQEILYLPFGHIKRDPELLLQKIETFIGVTPQENHEWADVVVHPTTKVELPEELLARVAEITRDQEAFLEDRFGKEFFAQTRGE